VHDYLTVDGRKIGKSAGNVVDPVGLAELYGIDAVRWWLLREVPRVGDTDFTVERLVARANEDLANGLGNLVNRVVSMIHRYRQGWPPPCSEPAAGSDGLTAACQRAPGLVDEALAAYDFRRATAAVWTIVDEANRFVEHTRPWALAKAGRRPELNAVLGALLGACRTVSVELVPFLPAAAARIAAQCEPVSGRLPAPRPPFPRLVLRHDPGSTARRAG
jgi:methionyl-tRNA synthetase